MNNLLPVPSQIQNTTIVSTQFSLLHGKPLQYIWLRFNNQSAIYLLEWLCGIFPYFKEKLEDLKVYYQPDLDMWAEENRPKLLLPEEGLSSGILLEEIARENNIF